MQQADRQQRRVGWSQGLGRSLVVTALLGAGWAQAASITIYNTGVADDGTKLSTGAAETHWKLNPTSDETPALPVVVLNQHPSGQYYTAPDAMWIWANSTGAAVVGSPYTYHLDFDLTGYDPSTALLSGAWGVDNTGKISLNGAAPVGTGTFALGTVTAANFNTPYAFSITGGFTAGVNRLELEVTDAGNPAGFNVRGLVLTATAVPEPASLALFGAGLLALIGLARRARRSTATVGA